MAACLKNGDILLLRSYDDVIPQVSYVKILKFKVISKPLSRHLYSPSTQVWNQGYLFLFNACPHELIATLEFLNNS